MPFSKEELKFLTQLSPRNKQALLKGLPPDPSPLDFQFHIAQVMSLCTPPAEWDRFITLSYMCYSEEKCQGILAYLREAKVEQPKKDKKDKQKKLGLCQRIQSWFS